MESISKPKQRSTFEDLELEIAKGIEGKNEAIPIGLKKLGRYANIRKRILTLLFSTTGAGKSGMMDTIILNACADHMLHPDPNKLKPDFQLFSLERSKMLRVAKWTSFLVFKNEAEEIPIPLLMGWWKEKLTPAQLDLVKRQKQFIDVLTNEYVTIHEGKLTPMGFFKVMKDHFENLGEYGTAKILDEKTGKFREVRTYNPKDERIVVSPIIDHGNLLKTTKDLPTKKMAIDKTVELVQDFRDLECAAPFWVAQVNRSVSGVTRIKDGEHELVLEDVKESGDIGDACDIAISLFDPMKYGQSSKTGYKPVDFVDREDGSNYFRSAQILKSTYGADALRIPLGFNGFCGQFKELPKRDTLSDHEYVSMINVIKNKQYFLTP